MREDDKILTDTQNICDIFANLFSTIATHIDPDDNIDTSQEIYLSNILMKHSNHKIILEIKENYSDQTAFNFRKVESSYIYKLLHNLNANKATGYDTLHPKVV